MFLKICLIGQEQKKNYVNNLITQYLQEYLDPIRSNLINYDDGPIVAFELNSIVTNRYTIRFFDIKVPELATVYINECQGCLLFHETSPFESTQNIEVDIPFVNVYPNLRNQLYNEVNDAAYIIMEFLWDDSLDELIKRITDRP